MMSSFKKPKFSLALSKDFRCGGLQQVCNEFWFSLFIAIFSTGFKEKDKKNPEQSF